MKWYHWGLIAFSAIAGGWIGVWWTKGGVPHSGDPGSRTIAEPVKAVPIGGSTREKPEWRNLLEPFPTLSQLAAQATMLEHLETVEFRRLLERAGAGRIKDQATAALLAERIGALDEAERRAILQRFEVRKDRVLTEVYAALFPEQAAADFIAIPSVRALRSGTPGHPLRVALGALAAAQPEEAAKMALDMESSRRSEAILAVANVFARDGRGSEALELVSSLPRSELHSILPGDFSGVQDVPAETILNHPGPLPRSVVLDALSRMSSVDPVSAVAWLQRRGAANATSASSFANGVRDTGDAQSAAEIEDLVSQIDGPGSAALRRETMGALAYAAAQHFPEELIDRLQALPEGNTKDRAIAASGAALAKQDDEVVLSFLQNTDDGTRRLSDALIYNLNGQPQRLVQLSESLPQDVQERIVSQLKELWGEEIDPYLK